MAGVTTIYYVCTEGAEMTQEGVGSPKRKGVLRELYALCSGMIQGLSGKESVAI